MHDGTLQPAPSKSLIDKLPVSTWHRSWLKEVEPTNMFDMFVTLPKSHVEISPLKEVAL